MKFGKGAHKCCVAHTVVHKAPEAETVVDYWLAIDRRRPGSGSAQQQGNTDTPIRSRTKEFSTIKVSTWWRTLAAVQYFLIIRRL